MEIVTLLLAIDPADAGDLPAGQLQPAQRAALVRTRVEEILGEEDDTELATRISTTCSGHPHQHNLLSAEEQATLLDIVKRYHAGEPANHIAPWLYGLIANSRLNDGTL